MSDPELEAIRARRMAELQKQHGMKPGGMPGMGGPGMSGQGDQQRAAQERKEKEEEMRNNILSQVLSQEARARLSNIAIAKPDRAKMLENILIQNVQRGAIQSKLSEEQLINFLEQVNTQITTKKTTVTFDRRRMALDDSDDDLDDL